MSDEHLKLTLKSLKDRFGVPESQLMKYPPTMEAEPEQIVDICKMLRDEFGFNFLCELTAVDYWPEEEPRFHVVYQIYSNRHNVRISLRVPVSGGGLRSMAICSHVAPGAPERSMKPPSTGSMVLVVPPTVAARGDGAPAW